LVNKTLLLILDGWGIPEDKSHSAPDIANTPNFDNLLDSYSSAQLLTHEENVGLPSGQMGNSEVGHINIGAGRIVLQDLLKINNSIESGEFSKKENFIDIINYIKKSKKNVHLIGLLSDGGVHSHISHLKEILYTLSPIKKNLFIHAFTDGRDVDPKSGINFINQIEEYTKKTGGSLASVIGRYYSMDRDHRWDRTKKAYDLLINNIGLKTQNIIETITDFYNNGITDEFIEPIVITDNNNNPISKIDDNDVIIFFNYRSDRGRQLTSLICEKNNNQLDLKPLNVKFYTLTNYDNSFENVKPIFYNENLKNTLGEILSKNNKSQLRIAETEKYPHVTFFLNGGREKPFDKEKRVLCPSPKVATYDLKPEMSAFDVSQKAISEIINNSPDFICLNFANPDMVGHTGDIDAAIKACETIDGLLGPLINAANKLNYVSIIIADHGNCEKMKNEDGSPNTSHTTNPVPIILVDKNKRNVKNGILSNIAPTVLEILGIEKPLEMTANSLIKK
jgi:2,3-bisphosphoglycerate-independent phosphoglycerate mutase